MIGFAAARDAAAGPGKTVRARRSKNAPRAVVRWRRIRPKRRTLAGVPVVRVSRRMKIAVCAKVVPEQARRIDPETKRLDRSGDVELNPFDSHAVEEALRLKGDDAASEGVLVSLG